MLQKQKGILWQPNTDYLGHHCARLIYLIFLKI